MSAKCSCRNSLYASLCTHIGVVVVLGGGTPGHNSDGGHSSLHSQGLERSQSKNRHSGGLMLDTVGTWVVESKGCALSREKE